MSDDPMELPADNPKSQQPSDEARERLMRLGVWLNGLLTGGPPLAEAVKPWREGLSVYNGGAETFASDPNPVCDDDPILIEKSLMAACRRLLERRKQEGNPPIDIVKEEHRRRLTEILDEIQAGRSAGEELTPMRLVLAARYIEGEIDSDNYRSRMRALRTP